MASEQRPESHWTAELVRRLLRHVREPARLEMEPGIDDVKRAMQCATGRDAVLALIDRALRHEAPLLREIVRLCDIEGVPTLTVAADVSFSPRQFFRYRGAAIRAIAQHLDRALEQSVDRPRADPRSSIAIAWLLMGRRSVAEAYAAIRFLNDVVARQPDHAEAYACLSGAYLALGTASALPPAVAYRRASVLAETALALEPGSAEVKAAHALALFMRTGDAASALPFVEDALSVAPTFSRAHHTHSLLRQAVGDHAGARQAIARAIALEPTTFQYHLEDVSMQLAEGGAAASVAGRFADLLLVDSRSRCARWLLSNTLIALGRNDEALDLLEEDVADDGGFSFLPAYARALAGKGERARARAVGERMKRIETTWLVPRYVRAAVRAAVEDLDGTVAELEAASREEPAWLALYLPIDPAFDFVRQHGTLDRFTRYPQAS